jgi:hypothetical protein
VPERDEQWLYWLLDKTWDRYFAEVPQDNVVKIVFGKRARRQLGCITRDRRDPSITVIRMNGLFRLPEVPEWVVVATLVHELIHYAHGFNSPLEQKHKHPHAGGVIRKEYAERGLEKMYLDQKRWLKANWPVILNREFPPPTPRVRRVASIKIAKPFWL